jgi:hypothetical protein
VCSVITRTYGVLNEHTKTVHKHETGAPDFHTVCGATYNLASDRLRTMPIERAVAEYDADKCGRCFDGGNGY